MPIEPIVRIEKLNLHFNNFQALHEIDAVVGTGEVLVLIGPSGSGKSSLLRCVNRLNHPSSGNLIAAGHDMMSPNTDLPKARRDIGFVAQSFNLYQHMTALQNVMEGLVTVLRQEKAMAREAAAAALANVGLAERGNHYPSQLSGGQQQRVAIARALAMKPKLMLFDEATSALDPELTGEVLDAMKALADEKMSMIVVTHEMEFARRVADRIVMMADGRIVETGSPKQIFEEPTQPRTRSYLARVLSWVHG